MGVGQQKIKLRTGIPFPGTIVQQAFTGTTARATLPTDSARVRIASTQDCYYLLGDSTVEAAAATGVWLPAGVEEIAVGNFTHLAVIRDTTDGKLHIVRLD